MLSVECFGYGVLERTLLRVVCHHSNPCDRLQQHPMPADTDNQQNKNAAFHHARQHAPIIKQRKRGAKVNSQTFYVCSRTIWLRIANFHKPFSNW